MWKRCALAGACAIAAVTTALPAAARDRIVIDVAPPALRFEAVPAPRDGYAWAPGHWAWDDGRHVWVTGSWIVDRPGMYYHPDRWEYRWGRWHREPGGWFAEPYAHGDRDRDGIANRFDRDRDGDGVSNRFDDRPNHPYRY